MGVLDDVRLASACAAGDPAAIATLTRTHAATVRRVAEGRGNHRVTVEDVEQAVWVRLLVGPSPKIAEYAGRGKLRNWIRIVALRVRADLIRRQRPDDASDHRAWADIRPAADTPDLAHLKTLYAREFEVAFAAAVAELAPADRNLLRQRLVHRLPLARIATVQRVHQATVKRRLARIRDRLHASTQRHLLQRLSAAPSSWPGILSLVASRLDFSVGRLLQSRESSADAIVS